MDERTKMDELQALAERVATLEDALRYVFARLVESEKALLALHERQADLEAAMRRQLEVMQVAIDGLADVLRRWGGRPPGPAAPLSGVN
jgi:hypothetical protein